MTVLPGSLDYLYYNGVLDHIPYDVYDMPPVTASGMQRSGMGFPPAGSIKQSFLGDTGMNNINYPGNMNGSAYLNEAMKGGMYGNYGNYNDSFSYSSNYQYNGMQPQMQMYGGGYGGGINPYGGNTNISYQTNINAGPYPGNPGAVSYDMHSQKHSGGGFKEFINESVKSPKEGVLGSNSWLKGLVALGLIIATPILIVRGFRKAPVTSTTKGSFWSKLNPKNWNLGNISGKFGEKLRNFWSKINPKNWWFSSSSGSGSSRWKNFWSKINPKNWGSKPSSGSGSGSSRWKNFWSKINPKNWGSKPSSGSGSSRWKNFWSKINPKNWGRKNP